MWPAIRWKSCRDNGGAVSDEVAADDPAGCSRTVTGTTKAVGGYGATDRSENDRLSGE
jgi:hypothetical protein